MADPRVTRFWLASIQSGLLDVPSLNACWEAIPPEKRDVLEHLDRRLARQAIQQSLLTLWQAQQLLAGRTSGFQVDRYLLLDLIGHGGMGRVYLARDTRLTRLVALKILAPERMSNPRAIARFQREARVGAQLQHENLVRLYDFGEANGRYFLVMEYIEGKTIGALIASQGAMPPQTGARLARQIALGLEHAHRKGLIHRDVNPYNVLVTHDGIAKLADMGLAIDLAEEERVTREGATVGTFDYVAPEQARHSHAADIRSDIYSLGCTLYHMIAGQVPFPSPSLPEKLFAHQALEPSSLRELAPDVSPELIEVIRRMMRKRPEERYSTPLQVAQALEPFIDDQGRMDDGTPELTVLIPESPQPAQGINPSNSFEGESGEAPPSILEPVATTSSQPEVETAQVAGPELRPVAASAPIATPPPDAPRNPDRAPLPTAPIRPEKRPGPEKIPLVLDLGPEPSLRESLGRPRSRTGDEHTAASRNRRLSPLHVLKTRARVTLRHLARLNSGWWKTGLAAVLLLSLGLALYYAFLGGQPRRVPEVTPRSSHTVKGKPEGQDLSAPETPEASPRPQAPASPITVVGLDNEAKPVNDLTEAINMAIGSKGRVELRNREPLELSALSDAVTSGLRGTLRIQAAEGAKPVLRVELKGQPFLVTGPATTLILEGVEISCRYGDRPPPDRPIPFLRAAGKTELRNCRISNGEALVPGSRAVLVDGNSLTVENCCFQGWDTAIEVHASGGSITEVQNTMILPAGERLTGLTAHDAGRPEASGWGLRMEFFPSLGSNHRQLILKQCTVVEQGLLHIANFSLEAPLQAEVTGCAVRTRSLIGWSTSPSMPAWDARVLNWRGRDNQFEVTGPSWIVNPASAQPDSAAPSVDRNKWVSLMIERDLNSSPILFTGDPESHPDSAKPEDYEVKTTGQARVGASPAQVGAAGRKE